jgi:hypothetical protein
MIRLLAFAVMINLGFNRGRVRRQRAHTPRYLLQTDGICKSHLHLPCRPLGGRELGVGFLSRRQRALGGLQQGLARIRLVGGAVLDDFLHQ